MKTLLKTLIILLIGTLLGTFLTDLAMYNGIVYTPYVVLLLAIAVIVLICIKAEEVIKSFDNEKDINDDFYPDQSF